MAVAGAAEYLAVLADTKPQLEVGFQGDGQVFKSGLPGCERGKVIARFNIKAGIEPGLLLGGEFKKTVFVNNAFCRIAQQLDKA